MKTRILLDARAAQRTIDGITRFSIEVTGRLAQQRKGFHLSVLVHPSASAHFEPMDLEVIHSTVPRFKPGEDSRLSPFIGRFKPDAYINFSMAGPTPAGIPTIVTVHDLMVLSVPFYFGNGIIKNALFRRRFRAIIGKSVSHASAIACPGSATKRDIGRRFPDALGKVSVTGEGQSFFGPGGGCTAGRSDGPFLVVGNARAYKNLPRLLTAYGRVWAMNRGVPPLVMAIRDDRAFRGFKTHLATNPAADRITVQSGVSDAALRDLYLSCRALLMPSVYEGFGLPALEAMAAGAPVMASRGTALEELTGDAGVLVDPYSVTDIARGIAELAVASPEELVRMGERGMRRSSSFSWDNTAGCYAEMIEGMA